MNQPKRMPIAKLLVLEVHPFAAVFPMASDDELEGIASHMAQNGFRPERSILIFEGKILDGRNRRKALQRAIEIKGKPISGYYQIFTGTTEEALDFVISENFLRRHMSTSQKAIAAANFNQWSVGMNQHCEGSSKLDTHKQIADRFQISRSAVFMAKKIRDRGNDALINAVETGKLKINSAEALIELGDKDLAKLLAKEKAEIVGQAQDIRTANKAASRALKADKLNNLSQKSSGLVEQLPRKAFPILYVDAAWKNEVWSQETGNDKSPPYPGMEIEAIKALCAGDKSPALEDALCFFWTTANRIAIAIDVIRAWGFEQVSAMFWDKEVMGTGRWSRDQVEVLLICKRGKIHAPDPSDLERSLYSERRGDHSVKPVHFAELIDRQYPTLQKLEMFQRERSLTKGDIRLHKRKHGRWSFWGNEAGAADG